MDIFNIIFHTKAPFPVKKYPCAWDQYFTLAKMTWKQNQIRALTARIIQSSFVQGTGWSSSITSSSGSWSGSVLGSPPWPRPNLLRIPKQKYFIKHWNQDSAKNSTSPCYSTKIRHFGKYSCMNLWKKTPSYSPRPQAVYLYFGRLWRLLVESNRAKLFRPFMWKSFSWVLKRTYFIFPNKILKRIFILI